MIDFASSSPAATPLMMLGGGLLAFLSPCVLPMLPVYALYLLGGAAEEGRGVWKQTLLRCLGLLTSFVLLFTLMGAGAGLLGGLLKNTDRGVLNLISGGLMIVFGLWMLGVFRWKGLALPNLQRGTLHKGASLKTFVSALVFGLVLALSWSPCMTPLLSGALVLAASQENATMLTGMAHLAFFGLGLALPMILFILLYQWLKGMVAFFKKHQALIRRLGGGLMVLYGLYVIVTTLFF